MNIGSEIFGKGFGFGALSGAHSTLLDNLIFSTSLNGNSTSNIGTNNGTDTNITYSAGQFSQAAVFNGTSRINFSNLSALNGLTTFSCSYWINCSITSVYSHIGNWFYGTNTGSFYVRNNGNSLDIFIPSGPTTGNIASFNGFTGGVWNNVIFLYDGTQSTNANKLKLYFNGTAQALTYSTTIPTSLATTSDNLLTGSIDGLIFPLYGSMDEINMWNRIITPTEIITLQTNPYPFT